MRRGMPRVPWTLPTGRLARQAGHGSSLPRSYRDDRLSGRRCMLPLVQTLAGRRCRCWAWCFLSWVVMSRVALCVSFSHCQDKGNSQNPRAGMARA